jgi:GR25 family glycosyltransferase involved in LPS biosynthesis
MESFDKIFVINLEERTDRLERVSDLLHYLQIPFEKVSAIHKSTVQGLHSSLIHNYPETTLTLPGYLACLLSHLSIYKTAIDRGYKSILIFEDDILVHKNIKDLFKNVMNNIPLNWDVLYLGYLPLSEDMSVWSYRFTPDSIINELIVRCKGFWCTHAYCIKDTIMKHIISTHNSLIPPVEIDRLLVNMQKENFSSENRNWNFYGCRQPLIGQVASMSDLSPNFYTLQNEGKFLNGQSRENFL